VIFHATAAPSTAAPVSPAPATATAYAAPGAASDHRSTTPSRRRFFATLKRDLAVDHRRWNSEADARRDIFRWIAFYHHRRRHSALGYRSPAEYERTLDPTTLLPIAA
jgi:transposase InsO family protein